MLYIHSRTEDGVYYSKMANRKDPDSDQRIDRALQMYREVYANLLEVLMQEDHDKCISDVKEGFKLTVLNRTSFNKIIQIMMLDRQSSYDEIVQDFHDTKPGSIIKVHKTTLVHSESERKHFEKEMEIESNRITLIHKGTYYKGIFISPFNLNNKSIRKGASFVLLVSVPKNRVVELVGVIREVREDKRIRIRIKMNDYFKTPGGYECSIYRKWNGAGFRRMLDGLDNFTNNYNHDGDSSESTEDSPSAYSSEASRDLPRLPNSQNIPTQETRAPHFIKMDKYLTKALLGIGSITHSRIRNNYNLPPPLNDKIINKLQKEAIIHALNDRFTLIQGPPGTGKTTVSTIIAYNIHQLLKPGDKILICSPSNEAINRIVELLNKCGLKAIKLCGRLREFQETLKEEHTYHYLLKKRHSLSPLIRKLIKESDKYIPDADKELNKILFEVNKEIIDAHPIICCTCSASADLRLENVKFKYVLIDEASQALEPECMLPIMKGAEHLIIVGDHKQLGPVVPCRLAKDQGLDVSLFERLVAMHRDSVITLTIQYRMHSSISKLPNQLFYQGILQDGVKFRLGKIPLFNNGKRVLFCSVEGVEVQSDSLSFSNPHEIQAIKDILSLLLRTQITQDRIAVLTPYVFQRHELSSALKQSENTRRVEVSTIHTFQGKEIDYIILSCVRTYGPHLGLIRDSRLVNVAFTRARHGLIIVGNAPKLSYHPMWNKIIYSYRDNGDMRRYDRGNITGFRGKLRPRTRQSHEEQSNLNKVLDRFRNFLK